MPRLVSWFSGSVEDLREGLRTRDQLELESRRLRARLEELELELFRLRNVEEERDRLAAALDYTPQVPGGCGRSRSSTSTTPPGCAR
jgi:cell shape-determining protein MreC